MPILGSRMPDYPRSGGNGKKSARAEDNRPSYMGDVLAQTEGQLVATVVLILAARGAIFIGAPRAGNAILIRAWIGGDQYEDYCGSDAEVLGTLEALRDAAEAQAMRTPMGKP